MARLDHMSDRDVILEVLRTVERRLRVNRLVRELAVAVPILLAVLTIVRLVALFAPLGQSALWAVYLSGTLASIAIVLWRVRLRGTLDVAAEAIDRRAELRDEMRTAYWFMANPRASEWVDRQLQRAAASARALDVNRICGTALPRAAYLAAPLLLLFIGVNAFVPPAGAVGSAGNGTGTRPPGAAEVGTLRAGVRPGLEQMASEFRRAEETRGLGNALGDSDLDLGAEELRRLVRAPKEGESRLTQDLADTFRKAASNVSPGLEKLAQELDGVAAAIDSDDAYALEQAGNAAAAELERLDDETLAPQEGDIRENAHAVDAPPGQDTTRITQAGQAQTTLSDAPGIGGGGRGEESGARQGPPTTLDVQLHQEMLNGAGQELPTAPADIQQASQEERSALAYQQTDAELRQAEKDVLGRQQIPWQYRPLVKQYFEALRRAGGQ